MNHQYFKVTTQHDKGRTRFLVFANDSEHATRRVMVNENCPLCAVIKTELHNPKKLQK